MRVFRRKPKGYAFNRFLAQEASSRGWGPDELAEESGLPLSLVEVLLTPVEGFSAHVGADNERKLAAALYPDDPDVFGERYKAFERGRKRM
jgi:hypothetical protein